jgi:hypothetical protein
VGLFAGGPVTSFFTSDADRIGADFSGDLEAATSFGGGEVVVTGGSLIFLVGDLVGLFAGDTSFDFFSDPEGARGMFLVGDGLAVTGVFGRYSKSNEYLENASSGCCAFFIELVRDSIKLKNNPSGFSLAS